MPHITLNSHFARKYCRTAHVLFFNVLQLPYVHIWGEKMKKKHTAFVHLYIHMYNMLYFIRFGFDFVWTLNSYVVNWANSNCIIYKNWHTHIRASMRTGCCVLEYALLKHAYLNIVCLISFVLSHAMRALRLLCSLSFIFQSWRAYIDIENALTFVGLVFPHLW